MRKYFYRKTTCLTLLFCSVFFYKTQAQEANAKFPLIPYPTALTAGTGSFVITAETRIVSPSSRFTNEALQLNALLKQYLGKPLKQGKAGPAHQILLQYDAGIAAPEGYRLNITANTVILAAKEAAGMFRAVETVRQLLPADERSQTFLKKVSLPAVSITDQPAYAWRGMHLDVSRHFFSVDYLKKFIDRLALYKFNKFHIHLTDDQGWRIEIKKYPKLTEEGAWRTFNSQDSVCMARSKDNPDFIIDPKHIIQKNGKTLYGGFYTQQEMKAVVAYAAARHIDIIPEIDMPGHMMAAINLYPFLTCNGENRWGKDFSTPICPINESTYEFAQNVFTEIMDIFPSKYIHIGGDEVDRTDWEKSDVCRDFMAKNNMKTTAELQSYFINRMEKFFNSKGRKLIGWDEILEDGISSTAMVMYWRTWVSTAPVKAAKNGNQVVMSPGNPLYFDAQPNPYSISNVYHFNPIPKGLTDKEAQNIVGAQANTWTEWIPTENRADYMVFPRMTALAERLWTNKDEYETYLQRLKMNYPRLDALGVHYRLPDIAGLVDQNVFTDQAVLNPEKPMPDLTLRYTTDGSLPDQNSTPLNAPFTIQKSMFIRLAAFTPAGSRGDIYNLHYTKQTLAEPVTASVSPGLLCSYYPGPFKSAKLMAGKANAVFTVDNIEVPKEAKASSFGLKYQGYLDIPADGIYTFYLTCDDGGILQLAGREVVDNDGWHSAIEKSGQIAVKKGLQPLALDFVEGGGGYTLNLKYSVNGSAPQSVPSSWLKH
ncbi:family 20 glycosylhydrolase [Mucilaginibacter sp. HMF7410]|uniref:beta-N-acetylhexosaminidase n=1 Tax=Mucilaginibacter arboris TaxID=2682090 RepID=A0A7K1STL0_9SPHI|nr:family 20 glycosylhydrolase [Mucilaginibacter arboris]